MNLDKVLYFVLGLLLVVAVAVGIYAIYYVSANPNCTYYGLFYGMVCR